MLRSHFFTPSILELTRHVDRFVDAVSDRASDGVARHPALDAWRDEHSFTVDVELPGVRADDVELDVDRDEVTIRATRTIARPDDARPIRGDRCDARFERVLRFETAIDTAGATATLRDGVLRLHLPIAADARPRRVAVSGDGVA